MGPDLVRRSGRGFDGIRLVGLVNFLEIENNIICLPVRLARTGRGSYRVGSGQVEIIIFQ